MAALTATSRSDFGLDPITFERIKNPVIDPCGHTFDRATVELLASKSGKGEMICPFNGQVVKINKLVVNRFANDAFDYVSKLKSRLKRLDEKAKAYKCEANQLRKELELMRAKAEDEQKSGTQEAQPTHLVIDNETNTLRQNQESLGAIDEAADLRNAINEHSELKATQRKCQSLIRRHNRAVHQLRNVHSMSFFDRLLVTLDPLTGAIAGYRHLDTVKNRGLRNAR